MLKCATCGEKYASLTSLKNHHQRKHSGSLWTPEEYLGGIDSEQRDFNGEEPDDSQYNPEYLVDKETKQTKKTSLTEFGDLEDLVSDVDSGNCNDKDDT